VILDDEAISELAPAEQNEAITNGEISA